MDRFSIPFAGEMDTEYCAECGARVYESYLIYEDEVFCDKDCAWDWLTSKQIIREG